MQLLVRIVDKISDDKAKNIQLTKRGDVIVIKKDGEEWGIEELINPDWRIISVPDMTEVEAKALLTPEFPPSNNPDKPVMLRAFKLDLDALIAKGYKIDDARLLDKTAAEALSNKIVVDTLAPKVDVADVKTLKPIPPDPKVIGPTETIIG